MTIQKTAAMKTAPQAVHYEQVAFYHYESNVSSVTNGPTSVVSPNSSQKFKTVFKCCGLYIVVNALSYNNLVVNRRKETNTEKPTYKAKIYMYIRLKFSF